MGSISEHFSYSEFEKSAVAECYGIQNHIVSPEVRDAVKALVLTVLQPLRSMWGEALVINSGFRCQALNAHPAINGAPSSQHLLGEAADVRCHRPLELARLVKAMGLPFDQMILYPTFVHISHKLNGQQRGEVLYNYRYKGKRL